MTPHGGRSPDPRRRGATFMELMIAMSVVSIALLFVLQQISLGYRENDIGREKAFAFQKTMAILSEIQASLERETIDDAADLDLLDDGEKDNPVLTTAKIDGEPAAPDHPMSGNRREEGSWVWWRRITVQRVLADDRMRYVHVQVKRRDRDGTKRVVSTAGSIMNTAVRSEPAIKEYDVYLLALAASPPLWIPSARQLVRNAADEIAANNPGLLFRLHWITELGYGRDPLYTPFVNDSTPADRAAPWLYWYPGRLGEGSPFGSLYRAEYFRGRVRTEAGLRNGYDAELNPYPHAVADAFNHCMRTPDARALFAERLAAGLEDDHEPPLQILLADMHEQPERFRNAILVNLHGEGLPFPPLRNYSDAARDPDGHPGVRVVTHPAELRTPRDPDGDGDHADSRDVELRVYAYKTDPARGPELLDSSAITVQIPGPDLTANVNGALPAEPTTLAIERLPGGVNMETGESGGIPADRRYQPFAPAPAKLEAVDEFEMCYQVGFAATPEPHTWIRLYNTPLIAPPVANRGLDPSMRLYGMDYVPSPVTPGGTFGADLATDSPVPIPRNTARWRIRIPRAVLTAAPGEGWPDRDTLVTVVTRIGDDTTTGRVWPTPHEPANVSRTYCWWAASPDAVPITERYQLLGDPRHNPYADLCAEGGSFPHGYNWYFDDLRDGPVSAVDLWPCLDGDRLQDGFGAGNVIADVPRIVQVWREALQGSAAVLVNPTGIPGEVLLLGGEMVLPRADDELTPRPVTMHGELYGAPQPVAVENTATGVAWPPLNPGGQPWGTPMVGRALARSPSFWAKEWLGELAPDDVWGDWLASGNARTGPGASGLRRISRHLAVLPDLPAGTSFAFPSGARLGGIGPPSFVQADPSTGTIAHFVQGPGTQAEPTPGALGILRAAGTAFPPQIGARLPFRPDAALTRELPQAAHPGLFPEQITEPLESLSLVDDMLGAAPVELQDPRTLAAGWLVSVGHTPSSPAEHGFLARTALLLGLRGFHAASQKGAGGLADQPRVTVLTPTADRLLRDPEMLVVRWRTSPVRFDGAAYFEAGEPVSSEQALAYVLTYSADEGETWRYAVTGAEATPGTRPEDPSIAHWDAGIGDESYVLPLPAAMFPEGSYLLRVDCFDRTRRAHVAHHRVRFRIER